MRKVKISFQGLIPILIIGILQMLSNKSVIFAQTVAENVSAQKQTSEVIPKKWFPGNYVMVGENDFNRQGKGWTILRDPVKGKLFQGIYLYVTWAEIETTLNTYRWDKIDGMLNALPAGKKLALSLAWQEWNASIPPCPADMIDDKVTGLYRGGYYSHLSGTGSGVEIRKSTFYLTSTMTRYLDFLEKFAERYDSDPRLALITTGEFAGTEQKNAPGYNADTLFKNINRIPEMVGYFKQTPSGVLGDWWNYGGSINDFIRKIQDAGGGYGGPDILAKESSITPYIKANAGKLPTWRGMEWMDLKEFAVAPFPNAQMQIANTMKTNFIWWNTNNRSKETPPGYDFDTDVINYLTANPLGGITTTCPENMICSGSVIGINQTIADKLITFPNPANEVLKINRRFINASVTIFDICGTLVYQKNNLNTDSEIYIGSLNPGIYAIRFDSNENAIVSKFIKE